MDERMKICFVGNTSSTFINGGKNSNSFICFVLLKKM